MAWREFGRVRHSGARALAIVSGLLLLFVALNLRPGAADAANPPPNFGETTVTDQLFTPVQMNFAPDGRLFVLTKSGVAHVIENDRLLATPLFDLRDEVNNFDDRGLFSMAFDNNFEQNGFIYVVYVFDTNGVDDEIGETRLVRMTVNGNRATNEVVIFDDFPEADVALHYGGAVEHGPDGRLYVSIGDHLLGRNGQDRTNLKGTVIRLNTNGTIPTSNPFYTELTGVNRAIYAYGLRNPWQMSENPQTGEIFISDVGSNFYEELNVLERGANYGWFEAEGPKDPGDPASFVDPLWAYRHADNFPNDPLSGCAITGGAFYETANPSFPAEFRDRYFTGDFCQGRVVSVNPNTGAAAEFMDGFGFGLVDVAVSPINGDLYVLDQSINGKTQHPTGGVSRISFIGQQTDITITSQPSDVSIASGSTASFFVSATAPGDITYQWRRNGVRINGATDSMLVLPNVGIGDNNDRFTVDVTSENETVTSRAAVLRLSGNTAPVPTISFGGAAGGYEAGERITFSGSATDAEDGTIPSATLRWDVRLNHDDHDHSLIDGLISRNGSYTLPPAIETSTNVWITLYLTATDADGTSTTVTQRIDPKIVTITVQSTPGGLEVDFEGRDRTAPFTFDSVVGVTRELSAPASQTSGGFTFTFDSWSDGRGRTEIFQTPATNRTINARYTSNGNPNPGGGGCVVSASGNGIRLTYSNGPGNEVIRNNGGWVTTPPAGTTSYTGAGGVNDGWTIRRSGVDEVCSVEGDGGGGPNPGGGGPNPGVGDCVVTASGNGIRLTYSNGPGNEVIRNNGGWVTTPPAGTTSYTGAGGVNDGWTIRRSGVDEVCSVEGDGGGGPNPGGGGPNPGVGDCVVTASGNGIRLTWTDRNGIEVIRNNNGWVTTPTIGSTSYTGPGNVNDGWLVRRAGSPDETCSVDGGNGGGGEVVIPTNVCSVRSSGNGIVLVWQNRAGDEIIRNDGGWVATPNAGILSYTGAGDADDGWFIRRSGGRGDETCVNLG